MTQQEIESFLDLYDNSPSLVLFENLLDADYSNEEAMKSIGKLSRKAELNPIDVVLESLVNVLSEDISSTELTRSRDRVIINTRIRDSATKTILEFIGNDRRRLRKLHKMWLDMLTTFLKRQIKKDVNVDELVFLVSDKFRISALSAIKAISSLVPHA